MFNRKVVKVICGKRGFGFALYLGKIIKSHRAIRFAGCSCFYIQFSQKNIDKLQITVII